MIRLLALTATLAPATAEAPPATPVPVGPAPLVFVASPPPPRPAAPIPVTPAAPLPALRARRLCPPRAPGAAKPPTDRLLDAFPVLRRERSERDALPAGGAAALAAHGLTPADPSSARLLESTPTGGRTWIVPVPDVSRATPFPVGCGGPPPILSRGRRRATPPPAPRHALPVLPPPAPAPLPPVPGDSRPREGLAVVVTGDGPVPSGGALDDLVRGRALVGVDGCAGPGRDMLSVHALVPVGVREAFLTDADGSAVRADSRDGLVSFVVPRPTRVTPRYVVWTGTDGTPHVQRMPFFGPIGTKARRPCADRPRSALRVTPAVPGCELTHGPYQRRGPLPAPLC